MRTRKTTIAVLATMLLFSMSTAHADLLGARFTADLGVNLSHGPFDPDYILQIPFGAAVVGPDVEFDILGAAADFDATGLSFSNIEASMGEFPFNGYRFILVDPAVRITNVRLAWATIPGFDASYITFHAHAIAINTVFNMVGSLRLDITTVPEVVAIDATTWSAVKSLYRP